MFGYIYKTTCKVNGKIYVGQHVSEVFEPNRYIGSGSYFVKALKKYGRDSFTCELLDWAETKEELDELEKHYIKLHSSTNPDVGYNLCEGGRGGNLGYRFTDDQLQRLRSSHLGHKNSTESVKKQADKLRGRVWVHKDSGRKLIHKTDLEQYLMSGWVLGPGIPPYQSKPVQCFETGEVFASITDAHNKYHGALKRCLKSEYWHTCAGYHWFFVGDEERRSNILDLLNKK